MKNSFLIFAILLVFFGAIYSGIQFGFIQGELSSLGGPLVTTFGLGLSLSIYFSLDGFLNKVEKSKRFEKVAEVPDVLKKRNILRAKRRYDEIYVKESPLVKRIADFLKKIFNIEGNKILDLRMKLMAAGYYSDKAVNIYLMVRACVPVVAIVGVTFYVFFDGTLDSQTSMMYVLIAAAVGYYGVENVLSNRVKTRRSQIQMEFPDIIDLLTIYTESGVTLDIALRKVIDNFKKRAPNACMELSVFERELQVLPDRSKAYENLVKRADSPLIKSFASILQQSEKIGSPVSGALRTLGKEARRELLFLTEKKAAKIPTMMQLPMILFIMPSMMLVILGPTVIKAMDLFGAK